MLSVSRWECGNVVAWVLLVLLYLELADRVIEQACGGTP